MFDSEFKNAVQLYHTVMRNKSQDAVHPVSYLADDECDSVDGGINIEDETLESDLMGQDVYR